MKGITTSLEKPLETGKRLGILKAAEELFANDGFDRASLRAIAKLADVDMALIAHYFGSKQELFGSVIERRVDIVHRERLERLEDCRTRAKGKSPPIEDLVDAFLHPLFRRAQKDGEWRSYLRLISRLAVQRESTTLISKQYDPTAKYFINALRMISPSASDEELYWAYHFLLGALVFTGSDNMRIDKLSNGRCRSGDFKTAYKYLIQFVSAGIRGILLDG